jgi:hypothetical protein
MNEADFMNIDELFQKYKDISMQIIAELDSDGLENLDNLLFERGEILEKISQKNQTKEELKQLYGKYDLFKIDEDMQNKFEASMSEVKKEITKISKLKQANNGYNNINTRSVYLSKKI